MSRILTLSILLLLTTALGSASGPSAVAQTAAEAGSRPLSLEWEPVPEASGYELRFTPQGARAKQSPRPLSFRTREAAWTGTLPPGNFVLQIRSFDQRRVPGEWDEGAEVQVQLRPPELKSPAPGQKLQARRSERENVHFEWAATEAAQGYLIQVENSAGEVVAQDKVRRPQARLSLPVGSNYRWRVAALWEDEEVGEASAWRELEFYGPALANPRPRRPSSRYVEQLEWSEVPQASAYQVQLERKVPSGQWQEFLSKEVTEPRLDFDPTSPSGHYRLTVEALAPYRESSETTHLEFFTRQSSSRDPASLAQARMAESLDKENNLYFIASYFLSQMNYSAVNHEAASAPNFDAIGGTGRLGAGYQNPSSSLGVFGIIDLSGFNIAAQNFTFASGELHGTWTRRSGANHLRLSSGLFAKELPQLMGSSDSGFMGVDKALAMGPHVGGDWWRALTPKLGFQVNARLYSTLLGQSPNQEDLNPSISMMFGLLGSYRLTPRVMGLAGYAYRLDQITYPALSFDQDSSSLASPGDLNSIRVQGHYLNLILEVDF